VALHVLETVLRLLHPIMPFVTEELWQRVPHDGESIMYAPWPLPDETLEDAGLLDEMGHLLEVVRAVRSLRHSAERGTRRRPAEVTSSRALLSEPVGRSYLATLARLDLDGRLPESPAPSVVVVGATTVRLGLEADAGREEPRLRAELQKRLLEITALEAKLENKDFRSKAPGAVVEREQARLQKARDAAERLRRLVGEDADERHAGTKS
jgi:valyl-tRNA synthetase